MNVGWVKADDLRNYLNFDGSPSEGDRFADYLIAITFDTSKNLYCVISDFN